jgi:hypothetical protein
VKIGLVAAVLGIVLALYGPFTGSDTLAWTGGVIAFVGALIGAPGRNR